MTPPKSIIVVYLKFLSYNVFAGLISVIAMPLFNNEEIPLNNPNKYGF